MEKQNDKTVRDTKSLSNSLHSSLFQKHPAHLKFFCNSKEEVMFFLVTIIEKVGKRNVNYLRPVFYKATGRWLLEVDVNIPEVLMHSVFSQRYQVSNEAKREETQQ